MSKSFQRNNLEFQAMGFSAGLKRTKDGELVLTYQLVKEYDQISTEKKNDIITMGHN